MLMKTIHRTLKISIFFLIIAFGFTGCIKREYIDVHEHYNEYYEGVELIVYNITVGINDWVWNPSIKRYECLLEFSNITNNIYEKGYVNAQIFVWENNNNGSQYETLKPLPFVQSYYDDRYDITYTETISYDISPGYILFSIQMSDLYDGDEWLISYSFKVSIIKE